MRSDIRNIQYLAKGGAFGRSEAIGFYVYGKRRDGRTVPCRLEERPDGSVHVWSSYSGTGPDLLEDITEFTHEEWSRVRAAQRGGRGVCNEILDARQAG